MGYNVQSLFYNKDMFAKAGLAEPPADGSATPTRTCANGHEAHAGPQRPQRRQPRFDPSKITQWGYYNRIASPRTPATARRCARTAAASSPATGATCAHR